MAIKFLNIRTKKTLVADTEPKIAALWASSDHSPNITQGQDFGWRLAPAVVVEMKRIKQNAALMDHIAARSNRLAEDVGEVEILQYISDNTDVEDAPEAQDGDYTDEYEAEIRRLEKEQPTNPVTGVTPVGVPSESLEDLEKRVKLEERLAAARGKNLDHVEPGPDAMTTTTKDKG